MYTEGKFLIDRRDLEKLEEMNNAQIEVLKKEIKFLKNDLDNAAIGRTCKIFITDKTIYPTRGGLEETVVNKKEIIFIEPGRVSEVYDLHQIHEDNKEIAIECEELQEEIEKLKSRNIFQRLFNL